MQPFTSMQCTTTIADVGSGCMLTPTEASTVSCRSCALMMADCSVRHLVKTKFFTGNPRHYCMTSFDARRNEAPHGVTSRLPFDVVCNFVVQQILVTFRANAALY